MLNIFYEEAKYLIYLYSILLCKQQKCIGAPFSPGPKHTQKIDSLSEQTGLENMQPKKTSHFLENSMRKHSSTDLRKLVIANKNSNKHI